VVESSGSDAFGKYARLRLLGTGATGEVWEAYDVRLRRSVALKILRHGDPQHLARFRREAQAAAGLEHPSIATVYESGEVDGTPYIAMRLVQGTDLYRIPHGDPRLPVRLIRDAALALHFAHQKGLLHRDIKPSNLLVEDGRIVVTDFGLARRIDVASSLTASGNILGTPAYMAPEQASGLLSQLGPHSDVYSLGATLYELVTGRTPFVGKDLYKLLSEVMEGNPPSPRSIDPNLDRDLESILLKCLEKEPRRRYSSARLLAEDLTRWLEGEPVLARSPSALRTLGRRISKRRWSVTTVILLAIFGGLAAIGVPRWKKERELRRERERELAARRTQTSEAVQARGEALLHLDSARRHAELLRRALADPSTSREEFGRLIQASLREYRKALALCPDLPEAHLGMARALAWVGYQEKALQALNEAIRIAPGLATAYLDRARIRAEQLESASHQMSEIVHTAASEDLRRRIEEDLNRVAQISRDRREVLMARAILTCTSGRYAESLLLFDEYLREIPTDTHARGSRGHALYHLGRLGEAEADLSRAIEGNAHDVFLYNLRGFLRHELGRYEAAVEDFTNAIRLAPGAASPYYGRARSWGALDRLDDAVMDATEALQRNPNHADAYLVRGNAHAKKKEWESSIRDYTRYIEFGRSLEDRYWGHFSRGLSLFSSRRYPQAISDFTKALTLKPDLTPAIQNRACAHLALRQFALAEADYTRVIELLPDHGPAYCGRATARKGLDKTAGAVQDARKALSYPLAPPMKREMEDLLRDAGQAP